MIFDKVFAGLDLTKPVYIHTPQRAQSVVTVMSKLSEELSGRGYQVEICYGFFWSFWLVATKRKSVHILNLELNFFAWLARCSISWIHGIPTVSMTRTRRWIVTTYTATACRFGSILVPVSNLLASTIRKNWKVNGQLITISNKWVVDSLKFRSETNSDPRPIDVIYIGRMSEAKRTKDVERLFDCLVQSGFSVEMWGTPPIDSKHYKGRLDYPDEVAVKMSQARFFLNLNSFEPYGLTVYEAHLAGCTIVCPLSTGALEDVMAEKGSFCVISDENDYSSTVQTVKQLLE
jgi:glycosyltransferase involved in cell wall biosynthesis